MDRDEKLWDYHITQSTFTFTELATSLIGIGALFFAFGTVGSQIVRTVIALVGLGGSLVLWHHSWAASRDREGVFEELALSEEGRFILKRLDRAGAWRDKGRSSRLYVPVTRTATWFMGWVVVAWIIVLIENDLSASDSTYTWPSVVDNLGPYWPTILTVGGAVIILASYLALLRSPNKGHAARNTAAGWPNPPEIEAVTTGQTQPSPAKDGGDGTQSRA